MEIDFVKMHGLGNDFLVVDGADAAVVDAVAADAARLASRRYGVGCDQILLIIDDVDCDVGLVILNRDGSVAEACGNGARCVAELVLRRLGKTRVSIRTAGGILAAWRDGAGIAVNMGIPRFAWDAIPLSRAVDAGALVLHEDLPMAMAVNLGNPHCVFVVDDAAAVAVAELGRGIENHPLFPEKTNVEFISLLGTNRVRMRVWERGVGMTEACGSGAVAAAVVAHRRGLTEARVVVELDGGALQIDWRDEGVIMVGEVAEVFEGRLSLDGEVK